MYPVLLTAAVLLLILLILSRRGRGRKNEEEYDAYAQLDEKPERTPRIAAITLFFNLMPPEKFSLLTKSTFDNCNYIS